MKQKSKQKIARILVVEDDAISIKGICETIRSFGYGVAGCARTGMSAIKKSKSLKPDLVLMDVILEGKMDGIEAAKKIREFSIPVIYMSAFADEEKINRAKETNPFGYIIKPFKNEELKVTIEIALQKRKSEISFSEKAMEETYRINKETEYFFNLIRSIVLVLDLKGKVVLINDAGCEILGYNRKELIGKNWFRTCIPKENQKEVENIFKKVSGGKITLVEFWENSVITKNGEKRLISWHNAVETDKNGKPLRILSSGDDITDISRMAMLSKKDEERYRIVAEKTGTLVYDYDIKTGEIRWSGAIKDLTGFSQSEFEKIDIKKWGELIHPDDRTRVLLELKMTKKGNELFNTEYRIKHKNNHYILVEDHGLILKNDKGKPTKMLGAMKDVTQSKQLLHRLEKSEERFRILVESIPLSIQGYDTDGIVQHWNKASEQTYGFTAKEAIGQNLKDLIISPELLSKYKKALILAKQAKKSGEFAPAGECRLKDKNGKPVDVFSVHTVVKATNADAELFCIDLNLKERKKIEMEVQQNEEKYRSLFENMRNSFALHKMIFNKTGKPIDYEYIEVNNAFLESTGLKKENVIGQRVTKIIPGTEKDPANWIKIYGKVATSMEPIRFEQFSQGLQKWFSVYAYSPKKGYFATIFEDITEKKLSETEYKTIFENTGTATCILEADRTISLANTDFCELAGFTKEAIEGKMKWTDFVTNEYLEKMKKFHDERRTKKGSPPKSYEFDFVNAKGEKRNVLLYVDIIPDTKKSVASLLDITDRKQANQKLQESEEKYRSITENAQEMITVVVNGKFVLTNPRLHEILGYSKKDVSEMKSFLDFVHPDDIPMVAERHQKRLLGEEVPNKYSFRIKNKKGKIVWVEISATLIRWEGKLAVLVLMEDITQRHQKEFELNKFKLGFEKSEQVIFTTNTDGIIEYINPQFEKTYGYKQAEIIGKTPRILKSGTKDKEFYEDFWKKLLHKEAFHTEIVNKSKSGKLINIHASISPILNEEKALRGFLAIQTDITKQVVAERALREKVEQMEFMGRTNLKRHKRLMELEKENQSLKEKLKAL